VFPTTNQNQPLSSWLISVNFLNRNLRRRGVENFDRRFDDLEVLGRRPDHQNAGPVIKNNEFGVGGVKLTPPPWPSPTTSESPASRSVW
jgi:hypothetical protein